MNTKEIMDLGDQYLMRNVGRIPLAPVKGEGASGTPTAGNTWILSAALQSIPSAIATGCG